ncbi:protein of unknown function [Legionella hackeliae]|uniref:Transposase n=1 Tax=Legionella hackeliae TaxID=449 RepID=A0A0A8UTV3_LEGHA|nr:protein of unknown function [Legionella hackeliae]
MIDFSGFQQRRYKQTRNKPDLWELMSLTIVDCFTAYVVRAFMFATYERC